MHPTGNYQKIVARTSRVHGWSCWIPLSPDVFPHWGQNPLLTYWNWTRHVLHPEIYLSKTPKGIKSLEFKKCHWTKSRSFDVGPMSFDQGTSWVFSIRKTDTNCQVFFKSSSISFTSPQAVYPFPKWLGVRNVTQAVQGQGDCKDIAVGPGSKTRCGVSRPWWCLLKVYLTPTLNVWYIYLHENHKNNQM